MSQVDKPCLTCHGSGETATEGGPETCPDCFGDGRASTGGARHEWRLRELERLYAASGRETEHDVMWLINELRRARGALVRIIALCQDADESDALARDVKFQANDALGLYDATPPS